MTRRNFVILIILGLIFSTACSFSAKIPTTPTAGTEALPEAVSTRPQTTFIDGRTVSDSGSGSAASAPTLASTVVVVQPYSAQSGGSSSTTYTNTSYTWNCTPNYSWGYTYVVQPGGTLSNIALRAGTNVQVLAQGNCIADPNRIYVGQVLRVPSPVAYQPPPHYPPPHYPPPHYPPPSGGVVYIGQVLPSPFISASGGQYQLQGGGIVNLAWAINPNNLTRVDFILSPSGTGMSPVIVGTDTYFGDGISVSWAVPPGMIGSLSANGYSGGSLTRQTATYTFVYANAAPTQAPPPPVVVGSGLTFAPYDSINNNTVNLTPDQLITISWNGTFPAATDRVVFELIPPGESSGQAIGIDTNLGDGASTTWYAVLGTQGTIRGVAYFQGGYPPQYSDSYYVIAGIL